MVKDIIVIYKQIIFVLILTSSKRYFSIRILKKQYLT